MIELTNGEITLRPISLVDRRQWQRVRRDNREWLGQWEATVPKLDRNSQSDTGAASFTKMLRTFRKEAKIGRAHV